MRIAIFGDIRPQRINGFATSLTMLAKALAAAGHRTDLFSTTLAGVEAGAEIEGAAVRHGNDSVLSEYDVAILTGCFDTGLWRVALRCKRAAVPYVVSPRSSLMRASWRTSFLKKALSWPLLRFWYFKGDVAVHFLCEEERDNSWRGFQRRSFCAPNAISLPASSGEAALKTRTIGFLGRMDVQHKGLDILLEALALAGTRLRQEGYRIELVGPDYRGGQKKLKRALAELKLDDIVRLLPPKRGAEKWAWLRRISIFVHASRYEGQPQAVFEAIASGATPIVTPQCNMTAILQKLGSGHVVDCRADAFAGALVEAIEAPRFPELARVSEMIAAHSPDVIAARMADHLSRFVAEVKA